MLMSSQNDEMSNHDGKDNRASSIDISDISRYLKLKKKKSINKNSFLE